MAEGKIKLFEKCIFTPGVKIRCPDCDRCQMCSESRCRQCRDSRCADKAPELEKGFTYGRYQEWRQRKDLKSSRAPVIDIRECKGCETCVVLCPDVFKRNSETDIIEVVDLSEYPEEETEKAVSMCPRDCITWQDVP